MRWLSFLLLVGLAGCIQLQQPVWTEIPTAEQLMARFAATSGRFSSLDGAASVALTAGDKYYSSQQFLLLQKPNYLRTDVLTGFGQLVLQMASDGELLSVLLNTTVPGRFFNGPASDENVFRFTRVPLAARELLAILLYDPPLISYQDYSVELSSGRLLLHLSGQGRHQQLVFNQQLQVVGCQYFKDGEQYLAVEYQRFSGENGFPLFIKVTIPQEQTRVKVTFSELKVNEGIDLAKFRLKKPGNFFFEKLP